MKKSGLITRGNQEVNKFFKNNYPLIDVFNDFYDVIIYNGTAVTPTQRVSTFQQQPGLFQSLAGLGLSGLGLYRGLTQ